MSVVVLAGGEEAVTEEESYNTVYTRLKILSCIVVDSYNKKYEGTAYVASDCPTSKITLRNYERYNLVFDLGSVNLLMRTFKAYSVN
jgi:hypothetical protein